ncbi:MAG: hypothetical protein QF535_16705 [Anaerolineales bacterium]|nr:hypothetical protein [Anaerolineales bacterium]
MAESRLTCYIDGAEHPCAVTSVFTISPRIAITVGTHLYELKHVGFTDKSKGGWHLETLNGIGL